MVVWDSVVNQERVLETLKAALKGDRVAHAYLFHGPDGSGKKATAFGLAQALLCKSDPRPCGACNSCDRAARLIHPDLRLILPYAGDPKTTEITERFELLAEDPYAPVDFVHAPNGVGDEKKSTNKQLIVKRERVDSEVLWPSGFKAVEGGYKVVILADVDLVHVSGSNAVLKLLEEPPPKTVFILTTTRPHRLLPTIISRCQQVRFDRLANEHVAQGLRERYEMSEQQVDVVSRMAEGSLTKAIELADNQELLGLRLMVVDFLRDSYKREVESVYQFSRLIGSGGREQVKSALGILLSLMRDLVVVQATGEASRMVNTDQSQVILDFVANLSTTDFPAMIEAIEEATGLVGRNVNVDLVIVALSDQLHRIMRGLPTGNLYQPLADPEIS